MSERVQPYVDEDGWIRVKPVATDEMPTPDPSWVNFLRKQLPVLGITRDLAEIIFETPSTVQERSAVYEYKQYLIIIDEHNADHVVESTANEVAALGWETIGVFPGRSVHTMYLLLKRPRGEGEANEFGIPTDVFCVECAQGKGVSPINRKLERKGGAWWCPVHRDEGHVRFEARKHG